MVSRLVGWWILESMPMLLRSEMSDSAICAIMWLAGKAMHCTLQMSILIYACSLGRQLNVKWINHGLKTSYL